MINILEDWYPIGKVWSRIKIVLKMKMFTLFISMTLVFASTQAQTTYTISSSRNWSNGSGSSSFPSTCTNCTFNITSGATLTINTNVTCKNCTFNGGNITMTDKTLTLQSTSSKNTYFNNTKFTVNGSGQIKSSAPVYISNSVFNLDGTSEINSEKTFELSASRINLYGNSHLDATDGSINLKNNSSFLAGDGTLNSKAYILISSTQLTLYDNSTVVVANNNNYYYNLSYYYATATNRIFLTLLNNTNCGAGFPHRCSIAYLYGTASLTAGGVIAINSLPVTLTDFNVQLLTNHKVAISWSTQQETNSDYFSIERSTDGFQWAPVGTVAAKGNSFVVNKYVFTDINPVAGTAYYRLKMVDLDNTYMLSEIKSVKGASIQNINVYPNPTHDFVNVTVTSEAKEVRLMQANGQVLQQRSVTRGSTLVSFPVQQYTTGTYMVQVLNSTGAVENKIVVIAK